MLFYGGVVSFLSILDHREINQARTDHNWGRQNSIKNNIQKTQKPGDGLPCQFWALVGMVPGIVPGNVLALEHFAGHGRLWPASTGHGFPRPTMAGHGRP